MSMSPRLLRPRQTGFDPKSLPNLALWLDANDTATLGPTSSGPGTVSNNGPVKYWGDKSGNGRNATNSGADSVCPTFLSSSQNSKPAISFDGGDGIGGTWAVTLTSETVIVVGLMTGGSGGGRYWTQRNSDAEFGVTAPGHYIPILERTGSGTASARPWSSYADNGFRAAVTNNQNEMLIMASVHSGSQISNSTNNGAASTYSHTLNSAFTLYNLGQDFAGGGGLAGRMCEVIVYARALSSAELTSVTRYLGAKWGVTVS